jgi:interferon gamma-inducible protein 30
MRAQGVPAILDLNLWPFGNARENPDKSFTCQHGAPECKGNMVEACGQYLYNTTAQWFPYILCLEGGSPPNDGQKCATKLGYDWTKLNACYNDKDLSYSIMHKIAVATNALSPKKTYVPWVVLNGKPLYQSFNNILRIICQAYTGTKPPGCNAVDQDETFCFADQ